MNDRLLIPTLLCPKAWESISGHEAIRFCTYCKKHVHNLEAMSVSERLALLASPAASICARYKVAIRRPVKGKEESYMRHMLKYGAGVTLASSALLVLCEMYAENEKRTYYRAFAGMPPVPPYICYGGGWPDGNAPGAPPPGVEWPGLAWPDGYYVEQEVEMLGMIALPEPARATPVRPGEPVVTPLHIDLDLDPVEINKLLQPTQPAALELKTGVPVKTKKIRQIPGPRGWGA